MSIDYWMLVIRTIWHFGGAQYSCNMDQKRLNFAFVIMGYSQSVSTRSGWYRFLINMEPCSIFKELVSQVYFMFTICMNIIFNFMVIIEWSITLQGLLWFWCLHQLTYQNRFTFCRPVLWILSCTYKAMMDFFSMAVGWIFHRQYLFGK